MVDVVTIVEGVLSPLQRIRAAIKGVTKIKADLRQRYDDYSSVVEQVKSKPEVVAANGIEDELKRLTSLFSRVDDLIQKYMAAPGDRMLVKVNKITKRGANWEEVESELYEIDAEVMRQLAIMNVKGAISLSGMISSEMKTLKHLIKGVQFPSLDPIMKILNEMRLQNAPAMAAAPAGVPKMSPSYLEQAGAFGPQMALAPFKAQSWDRSTDQNGRPCWVNQNSRPACYSFVDEAGLPSTHYYRGGFPFTGAYSAPPMTVAPMAMAPMGIMSMCMPLVAPAYTTATNNTVAIVGDTVKEDKWSEYKDDHGTPFYHNPAKPEETTWEKPKDFDKEKNAGEPPPPTKPKTKGPKYKK